MAEKTKALATMSVVMPAVTPEEATAAWQKYQDLIKAVCTAEDYQVIKGKQFRKKSGWRKIATFFNLSTEIVEERQEQIGKTLVWHFSVKATAPNSRYATGVGSCDAFEKATLKDGKYMKEEVTRWSRTASGKPFPAETKWVEAEPNSLHNIRSTAESRATNRAISNLVGGGEVSAEEVDTGANGHAEPKTVQGAPAASEAVKQAITQITYNKCQYCGTTGKFHKKGCPGETPAKPAVQPEAAPEQNYQPVDEDVPLEDIPF